MIRWHPDVVPHLVPIETVHQRPGNFRNGDVEALMESIQVNGFFTCTLANRTTGNLVIGNHRYAALLGLGATQIPVLWSTLTPAEETRIAVADNRLSDLAWDDPALLADDLHELSQTQIGLLGSGWTQREYDRLVADPPVRLPPEAPVIFDDDLWQVVVEVPSKADADELQAHLADQGYESRVVGL